MALELQKSTMAFCGRGWVKKKEGATAWAKRENRSSTGGKGLHQRERQVGHKREPAVQNHFWKSVLVAGGSEKKKETALGTS